MTGKQLPPGSDFAGDDGSADPALSRVLASFAKQDATLLQVVEELQHKRVLVPILAELEVGELTESGLVVDKEASAGVVAVQTPDGRKALPIFTSVETLHRWHPHARPVPVAVQRAALSAVSEQWSLLVLDPAGPVTVSIARPAVWALAQAMSWLPAVDPATGEVDPLVHSEVITVLEGIDKLDRVTTSAGRQAELAVGLFLDAGLDRAGLDQILGQVNSRLAASTLIADRVDSLELRVAKA